MEWKPANSKLIKIRQGRKQINTMIIRFYASTNNNDKEMKTGQFLIELEEIPRHNMTIVIGDVNAKAERDTQLQENHGKIGLRHHWWEWSEAGGTLNNLRPHHWSDTLHTYPQVIWCSRQKGWKPDTPLHDRWYLAAVTRGCQNKERSWR